MGRVKSVKPEYLCKGIGKGIALEFYSATFDTAETESPESA